jgi:hypothetical protein
MDLRFVVLKACLFWADSGFGDFYVIVFLVRGGHATAKRSSTKVPMALCGWNLGRECRGEVAVVDRPPHTIEWEWGRDAAERARGLSMIDDQSFRD